jgi:hypothetical protein
VNDLSWERRKQRFLDMLPALKESAGLVVSIVGVV